MRSSLSSVSSVTEDIPHCCTTVRDAKRLGCVVTALCQSRMADADPTSAICAEPSRMLMCQGMLEGFTQNIARLSRTCWYCISVNVLAWVSVPCIKRRGVQPVAETTITSRIIHDRIKSVSCDFPEYEAEWMCAVPGILVFSHDPASSIGLAD